MFPNLINREKMFRRRQFVLGPEFIKYPGWRIIKIEKNFNLSTHPDLMVNIIEKRKTKAVLIGYAIDPFKPDLRDQNILERFVENTISLSDCLKHLETLSGRFVLIVKSNDEMWLFPDAFALRQVNFCVDAGGFLWCASQAEVLAEQLDFNYDKEVLSYRDLPVFKRGEEEFWLLNDRSPFDEIKNLLANHYLDLIRKKTFRFWPYAKCLPELAIEEIIRRSGIILKNTIKTAACRFNLKMGVTAGIDSRRTLSATKEITDKICFFTHTPRTNKADITVPSRLLAKLGIEHHKLELIPMSNEFNQLFNVSATWPFSRRGHIAHTALINFGLESVILNSNISEVHRCCYWLPKTRIDGKGLAIATRLKHPLAVQEFEKWLKSSRLACKNAKINILTLFDYELRSRWVISAFCEYDIVHDTFNPYNNRLLSSLQFAIPERYRSGQSLESIYCEIKKLWPKVLDEPINPAGNIKEEIKKYVIYSIIHKYITPRLPLYQYLRYLKMKRLFRAE